MEAKEVDGYILRPFVVDYSDLILLSSSSSSPPLAPIFCKNEHDRLESISASIMEALGPSGPGLISITGVPKGPPLRKALLPMARKLALLPKQHRAPILKAHGLGSDVPLNNPDRTVSSFALQLKLPQDYQSTFDVSKHRPENYAHYEEKQLESDWYHSHQNSEFEMGHTFRQLGFCMMELGLRLARICDKVIGNHELEHSILESCLAKGRLIHYHSTLDNNILKGFTRRKKRSKMAESLLSSSCGSSEVGDGVSLKPTSRSCATEELLEQLNINPKTAGVERSRTSSDLWQQWHYDYGIFTILTTPMFLSSNQEAKVDERDCFVSDQECSSPSGHTYLQLFDDSRNKTLIVKSEPESFIVQIGESAEILSRGSLCSTLHSVVRPDGLENVSRETFVVFMQPAWNKVLRTSDHFRTSDVAGKESTHCAGENHAFHKKNDSIIEPFAFDDRRSLMQGILRNVPPLSSRLRDGMTFAEFSRETTRQYYGGSGKQSKR